MKNNKFIKIIKSICAVVGIAASGLLIWTKLSEKKRKKDEDLSKDTYVGAGVPVQTVKKTFYEKYMKRFIDIVISVMGIIVLSPVFIVTAVAIFITDPGPVFFTQKRVGVNKTFFKLYKFRSMKMSTPHDVPTHMLDNPESYITTVGKFIRKTSIDELPQLFNILEGNLSLVGPRPALWNQEDLVAERDKYCANDVMPGLTGWAQINGRDELEIPDKAKLDGEYVERLRKNSFSGIGIDTKCFFGTITSVLKSDGVVEGGTGEMKKNARYDIPDVNTRIGFGEEVSVDLSQKKKVLITGANSYIGESFEKYAKEHYTANFEIDTVDMIDGSWREKDFSEYDTVFHVAGIAHADVGKVSEEVKDKYYAVNTDLAIETANKAKKDGVKQFVFMSSMIVYGESAPYGKQKMITADTKPEPANFYGDSKWQADKGVRVLADEDFNVLVLRPPMIYGKGSKGNYPTLAKLAKKLPVFPDVNNQRSMLYIENLCEFLCQVMLVGKGGIFFPQNDEYTRTSEMVKIISETSGKNIILMKAINPLVLIASKMPGRIGVLINKAFGNCCYAHSLGEYKFEYKIFSLKDSVVESEGMINKNTKEVKLQNLKGKNVLLISLPGYADGIVNEMQRLGANVKYVMDKPNECVIAKTLGRVGLSFYQNILHNYYTDSLSGYKEMNFDYVLVIRGEYTPIATLKYIKEIYPNTKLILYMWDGLHKHNTKGIEKKWNYYDKVYTFDRIDYLENKDKIDFLPLYYYEEYLPKENDIDNSKSYLYDLSFIGTAHDDRIKIVRQVMNQCQQNELKVYSYFYLPHILIYIKNKLMNKNFKHIKYSDISFEMLPFNKLYDIYSNSRCVIDVENKGQHGLTMRSIEILGLKRKFITTNKDIVNYDFYDPDNIFILDRDNPRIDCVFFDKPYKHLSDEIYEKYSLKNWILEVLK